MRLLLLAAGALALAAAKPETYKEKEDFQFSRSSSDDGTKSGYYGAQRGNMGGNYERAHNMDALAQNQMSGLVKQVEGDLGDGSKTRTGSVYSAANSRGVYGSGHYDLGNLAGRNFQEGETYGNSESHSSSTNSAYQHQSSSASKSSHNNNQYQTSGHSGGYQAAGYTGQLQSSNLYAQAANNENRGSEYNYGQRAAQSAGYYSQSGNRRQSAYDNTNSESSFDYGSNVHRRLISATPVRVVVRPGTGVTIPLAAQTYDTARTYDDLHHSFSNGQNSVNSEAEVLGNTDHQTIYQVTTKPKHYESSYRYHKKWEKHDTSPVGVPLAIPTSNSFPKNSELYEDTQEHKTDTQYDAIGVGSLNSRSSNAYSGYNTNSAASSQSQYQTDYNSQHQGLSSGSNLNSANGYNTYDSAKSADSLNQIVGDINSKPKSYQSSYSYHKSWERQGDPYVIIPASGSGVHNGQSSQKLTAASSNQGTYASHQYDSNYQQSQQRYINHDALDCGENGHNRVARSYDTQQPTNFNENQQSQNIYEGQEELSQKSQNLEDFGQQYQTQWDNLQELGQQTQNKWDKLEDVGQQAQNKWDKLEDLGQQTQQKWDKLEEAGQQTQNKWDKLEETGQQTQNKWDNLGLEDLGQQTQKDLGQQTQDTWNNFDIRPQENDGQQTQTNWDNLSELNQQIQSTQHEEPDNVHSFDQIESDIKPESHQVLNIWDKIGSLDRGHDNNEHVRNMQADTQLTEQLGNTQNFTIKPVWEQNADDTQQNMNTGLEFYPNTMPQYPMNNIEHFHPQGQTGYPDGFNMNTQTDQFPEKPNMNVTSYAGGVSPYVPNSSSLGSLWDKIDNIIKVATTNDTKNTNSNNFAFELTNSQHYYNNSEQAQIYQYNNNLNSSQIYQNNQFGSHYIGYQSWQPNLLNENKTSTEKPINENKLRPQDIGRGDIGPEDSFSDEITTKKIDNMLEFNTSVIRPAYHDNKYKSPEEIDSLSLTKENDHTQNNELPSDTQKQHSEFFYPTSSTTTSSTTPKGHEDDMFTNNQQFHKLIENQQFISEKENLSKSEGSSTNDKFHITSTHLDQGPEEIYQHNNQQYGQQNQQHQDQQSQNNLEQQFESFEQQNEQQNMGQQYEGFGQQHEQQNQQNLEQKFEIFGQQNEQQNLEHQFESFEQQNEQQNQQNMGQQYEQQNQQNLEQKLESFGQQNEQQNLEQQFESFGRQNDKIEQKNTDQFVDFGQQNVEQQLVDLAQQNKNLSEVVWSKHLKDLGQEVQTPWNQNQSIQRSDTIGITPIHEEKEVPFHIAQSDHSLEVLPTDNHIKPKVDIESPQEEVTENPGFWKTVGNKFTGAKDKVFSWFKKS